MYRLLVILLLVSCSTSPEAPSRPGGSAIEVDPSVVYPQQKLAISLARDMFSTEFEMDLSGLETTIHWTTTTCPYSNYIKAGKLPAVVHKGECFHGAMYSCDEIYVAAHPTINESALTHELVHCFLQYYGFSGDGEHKLKPLWRYVRTIDAALKERDW